MTSINTNASAMNALATLRNINMSLNETQGRVASGLKVVSAKDNAAYFAISESMKSDSGMLRAIDESLDLTKQSVATARLGAETFQDLADRFVSRVAFAQEQGTGLDEIELELKGLVADMKATIAQSTFDGNDLVNAAGTVDGTATGAAATAPTIDAATGAITAGDSAAAAARNIVTGVSRDTAGAVSTTSISLSPVDLYGQMQNFEVIAGAFATNAGALLTGEAFLGGALTEATAAHKAVTTAATTLGVSEKSIETQQSFLKSLVDNIDSGVGAMVDADMEEEAARLQALQVQQQLATQALSIANQSPQNILSLFR